MYYRETPLSSVIRDAIVEALTNHECMTRIVYTDTSDRTSFQCQCLAEDTGTGLWGRAWMIQHHADVIMAALLKGHYPATRKENHDRHTRTQGG